MTSLNSSVATDMLEEPKATWIVRALGLIRRQPLASAGGFVVLIMIVATIFADVLSPYDPEAADFMNMLSPPNAQYWFCTDMFGRDILTRIIYGARTALFVGFTAAFIGATAGLILGVASAYFGGLFDLIVQRIVDIVMAFPLIVLALAIVAAMDADTEFEIMRNVIIAITIPFIPQCARVVRSSALAIREIPYVDAARALGFSHTRIIMRHMVPNVMAPYLIMLTTFVGQAILLEASLSYLGMGVQEPTPAWGLMLQGGAEEYAESAPWVPIFPGLAITIAVFGFNLFGDGLRDVLDPRLRSR